MALGALVLAVTIDRVGFAPVFAAKTQVPLKTVFITRFVAAGMMIDEILPHRFGRSADGYQQIKDPVVEFDGFIHRGPVR